jgi:hypothetical protein
MRFETTDGTPVPAVTTTETREVDLSDPSTVVPSGWLGVDAVLGYELSGVPEESAAALLGAIEGRTTVSHRVKEGAHGLSRRRNPTMYDINNEQ